MAAERDENKDRRRRAEEEGKRAESEGLLYLVSKVDKRTNKRTKEAEKIKNQKDKRACGREREERVM